MNKYIIQACLSVLLFSFGFAIIHYYLLFYQLSEIYSKGPVWIIYLFLVPFTIITILATGFKYKIDNTSVGKTYLALVVFKIVLTIAFFYPWLFPKSEFSVPFVKQFFALFFPLLFIELKVIVGLLNKSFDENKKNDENQ